MARRGDMARQAVMEKIIAAFASTGDYVDTQDKKIYVQAADGQGGEILQFAISLTMPKVQIAAGEVSSASTQDSMQPASSAPVNTELSQEDKDAVARLMKELGIND